jgi:hypothetical protein
MDSSSFIRVVTNMMARYGGPAKVQKQGEGVYDPATSEYTAGDTLYPVKAMVFDYTLQSNGLQTEKNTLIQTGDKQVFIQNLDYPGLVISPEKDFILLGDKKYRIITYKELNPSQEANILMELFVRA